MFGGISALPQETDLGAWRARKRYLKVFRREPGGEAAGPPACHLRMTEYDCACLYDFVPGYVCVHKNAGLCICTFHPPFITHPLIYPFTHMPTHPLTHQPFIHLSTSPPTYPSSIHHLIHIHPTIHHLFFYLLINPFAYSSIHLPNTNPSIIHLSIYPSNDSSIYPPSIYPSSIIYLFIYPSIYPSPVYSVILYLFIYQIFMGVAMMTKEVHYLIWFNIPHVL